ncbi:hypothetical protein SAMN05421690_101156 [Nitrosomonas sp. Nm51]|nr:hypothetical protein SAMN05421690_101156 [Nitrosomonas sp. Nm51]
MCYGKGGYSAAESRFKACMTVLIDTDTDCALSSLHIKIYIFNLQGNTSVV